MFISNRTPVRRIPGFEVRGNAVARWDKLSKDLEANGPKDVVDRALAVLEAISKHAGEKGEVTVTNDQGKILTVRVK